MIKRLQVIRYNEVLRFHICKDQLYEKRYNVDLFSSNQIDIKKDLTGAIVIVDIVPFEYMLNDVAIEKELQHE